MLSTCLICWGDFFLLPTILKTFLNVCLHVSLLFSSPSACLKILFFAMFLVFLLTLPPPVLSQNKMKFLAWDNGYFYTGPESTWESFLAAVAFVIPSSTVQMQGQALGSSRCCPFQSKREMTSAPQVVFLKELCPFYTLIHMQHTELR